MVQNIKILKSLLPPMVRENSGSFYIEFFNSLYYPILSISGWRIEHIILPAVREDSRFFNFTTIF